MVRRPKGNLKLMLIRPPQLQFFKDGIKITVKDTTLVNRKLKQRSILGSSQLLNIKQLFPKSFVTVYL